MDGESRSDPMYINLSNVFSPHGGAHMSERVYDVDMTEYGNPMVETNEDNILLDREEISEINILNKKKNFE